MSGVPDELFTPQSIGRDFGEDAAVRVSVIVERARRDGFEHGFSAARDSDERVARGLALLEAVEATRIFTPPDTHDGHHCCC